MLNHKRLNIRRQLGRNVRVNRLLRGWSQEQLAEICGLHRTFIGAVERAERNITLDNIEKIVVALEISASKLFTNCELTYRDTSTDKVETKEAIPSYYIRRPAQDIQGIAASLSRLAMTGYWATSRQAMSLRA